MPVTAYYSKTELESFKFVKNADLNELYQEVRELFPNHYLKEMEFSEPKKLLKQQQYKTKYMLLIDMGGESQMFNFPSDSFNFCVDIQIIMTYFYGLLNGYNKK